MNQMQVIIDQNHLMISVKDGPTIIKVGKIFCGCIELALNPIPRVEYMDQLIPIVLCGS